MDKFIKLTLLSLTAAIGTLSPAHAMLCKECTEAECKYLADKYSNGHYKMTARGCEYRIDMDREGDSASEAARVMDGVLQGGAIGSVARPDAGAMRATPSPSFAPRVLLPGSGIPQEQIKK